MHVLDRRREHLALSRPERAGKMAPAVEPHISEPGALLHRVLQKRHGTTDVIPIDMRHHEKLERALRLRKRSDALHQLACSRLRSAVDQDTMGCLPVSILDPQ